MRLVLVPLVSLALSTAAYGEVGIEQDQNLAVTSLVTKLESGDRAGSLSLIDGIFRISEPQMLVENSSEFVDLILGCEGILQERRQLAGNDVYRFRWECRAQGIEAWMAHDPEGPLVEVWDVADATMIAARANRRPIRPPTLEEAGVHVISPSKPRKPAND